MLQEEELPPSELGTLDYWNSTYQEEFNNFADHGEEGENWFGEGVTKKIIKWICDKVNKEDFILDVGCGNGTILIRLYELGYKRLTGIDYSAKAITLAEAVATSNGATAIEFQTHDLLSSEPLTIRNNSSPFKVVVDKGTYDAICLNPDVRFSDTRDKYIKFIHENLQPKGYFILTSCNWTFDELMNHFTSEPAQSGLKLVFIEQIKTPSLSFGGKSGNKNTSVIFQKE